MKHICTHLALIALFASAGILAASDRLGDGPTTEDPYPLLSVRPSNAEVLKQGDEAYRLARPLVENFSNLRKNNLNGLKSQVSGIGNANTAIRKMKRAAQRLKTAGEPAGTDLQYRADQLERELVAVVQAVKTIPGVLPALGNSLTKDLIPAADKHARKLPKLGQDFRAGKFEESERELYIMLDELEEMGHWYDAKQREQPFGPFGLAEREIGTQMLNRRRDAARDELNALRQQETPQFDALLAEISAASQALASAPQVNVQGQNVSGPGALAHFIERWKALQAAALRCRAYDWARSHVISTRVADIGKLERDHAKFNTAILPALAGLVSADAMRAGANEVGPLYTQYLDVLAPLVPLCPAGSVGDTFRPPLSQLAAKSPEFSAYVESYRTATSDLIRWRRRTSAAFAAAAIQKSKPLTQAVATAARPVAPSPGLVDGGSLQGGLRIKGPIPTLLAGVKSLVGQDVYVRNVVSNGPPARAASSRYNQRVMAVMPSLTTQLEVYLPILEYDLLVSDRYPPLTLETAMVMQQASDGNAVAVGAKVANLTLAGHSSYFARQDGFGGSLRLGPLPADKMPDDTVRHLVLTCDLEPVWVQYELFFIDVP